MYLAGAIANGTNIPVPKVNCTIGQAEEGSGNFAQKMCKALIVQCAKRSEICPVNEPTAQSINAEHSLLVCTAMIDSSSSKPSITDLPSTEQSTSSKTTNNGGSTEQPMCTCSINDNTKQAACDTSNIIPLGALIGLLVLLEIATVIGCILCVLKKKPKQPKPPHAR